MSQSCRAGAADCNTDVASLRALTAIDAVIQDVLRETDPVDAFWRGRRCPRPSVEPASGCWPCARLLLLGCAGTPKKGPVSLSTRDHGHRRGMQARCRPGTYRVAAGGAAQGGGVPRVRRARTLARVPSAIQCESCTRQGAPSAQGLGSKRIRPAQREGARSGRAAPRTIELAQAPRRARCDAPPSSARVVDEDERALRSAVVRGCPMTMSELVRMTYGLSRSLT